MKYMILQGLVAAALAVAFTRHFDGDKAFRVKPQDEGQVELVKYLSSMVQLDFWRPDSAHTIVPQTDVDFRVEADQIKTIQTLLEQNGMQYEILFQNVQEGIEKQFDGKPNSSNRRYSYSKYNKWEKIVAWTANIAAKYPKLVSRIQIGTTTEERPMYLLKVGKQRSAKNAIFIDCGIHAREWISPAFCQWFVKEATKTYGKDKLMTKLLNSLTFYILPVLNIDGYVWTWTADRMWRKNRSNSSNTNCIGTDLNRNFDVQWCSIGSSNKACSEVYCGPAAESEKETKAVANFIRNNIQSIKAYLSFHSYSQMLLYPYSYTYELAPTHEELNDVAKAAVGALSSLYRTNYTYGPAASTIYPTSGSSADWAYDKGIKYSFTFELRDRGKYGFLLPEYLIKSTCKETMLATLSIKRQ
uniref:Mast cell carboxypeptidase A-like isoform X2 n=1 Tax=Geotrypetes seraphini TaxID=260995 RepID=A0A6P8SBJ4_GEOSA|nr:mast cell carboxypeptidase A-like isoform X2 [Geotrypetes seraphini]